MHSEHPGVERRKRFLKYVDSIVNEGRNLEYGDGEENLPAFAEMLNILGFTRNGRPLDGRDGCVIQIAAKLLRNKQSPNNYDHFVDMAGYSAVAGGMVLKERDKTDGQH